MGACCSATKEDEEVVLEKGGGHDDGKDSKRKGRPMSEDERRIADAEFRECLKLVTILILNRLATALEYEKEGFDDLRKVRRLASYMDLMAPKHFEGVFRELFDVSDEKKAMVDAHHISYDQQRFVALLDACEKASFKDPLPSNKDIADRFQKAAKATQEELAKSATASDSSDLKIELNFFANCLDFLKGDIATNTDIIFEQIDKLVLSL
jgi:hypothetical protein